jgi:hypothetical protein
MTINDFKSVKDSNHHRNDKMVKRTKKKCENINKLIVNLILFLHYQRELVM